MTRSISFLGALLSWSCLIAGGAVGFLVLNGQAHGQALVNDATNAQQSSVAKNVVNICPRLSALGGSSLPGDEGDLFLRCNGAIRVANGGNSAEAANVLQQIAPEEVIAQQAAVAGATAPQLAAIAARVSAILGRAGRGSIAALPSTGAQQIQVASAVPMQIADLVAEDNPQLNERLGGFATGRYGFGDHNATSLEAAYDYDDAGGTVGVDYMLTDEVTLGGTFGYSHWHANFASDAGDLTTDSYVLGAYSVWLPTPALSISGYAAYGFVNYDSNRNLNYTDPNGTVNRIANGNTDGDSIEVTVNGYYDFTFGKVTAGPIGRLSYLRSTVIGFTETGAQGLNMKFQDQTATSFQSEFGGGATYPISTSIGVVTLQGRATWIHEYANDSRTITLKYAADPFSDSPTIVLTTDSPSRDRAGLGAGASLVLPHGITSFINFDTVLGQTNYSNYVLSVGARIPL